MSSETNLQLFPGVFRSTVGGENPGFFLHSDGRVGIGNKAPTTIPTWDTDPNSTEKNKLNVSGHTHIEGNLNVTGHLYGDGSNLTGIAAVIGGYWDLDASNNNIKYEAGNVGIGGVASGTEALTVYGDLNLKSGGQLKFNGQTPVFSNWSVDGSDISRSTGNVGIGGAASGTNKLKVHGTVEASGFAGGGVSTTNTGNTVVKRDASGNFTAGTITANIATVTQKLAIDGLFKVSDTSVSASVDINATAGSQWPQVAKLTAGDGAAGDQFGVSVSIDGDTMVIGAYKDDDKGSNSGSAYVFTRDTAGDLTSGWTQVDKLTAGDGATDDIFGYSVSIDGDTVVIGAWLDDDMRGSAYVFTRDTAGDLTSGWTQLAKLTADDGAGSDYFGYSVSIDGDTMVIGAYKDDDDGTNSGSAYVFTRNTAGDLASGWTQLAKLTAGDGAANDMFGYSVSISGDTVVIAALLEDDMRGSAYVFTRDTAGDLASGWTQVDKLTASDGTTDDNFGNSVSIDGDTIVIGVYLDDEAIPYGGRGSAYVYTRNTAGDLTSGWTQRVKLTASDGATGDYFGWSVAISGDKIVVGALLEDDKGSDSGSAYVFTRDTAGDLASGWTQVDKLTASDGAAGDEFGRSVSIDGDTMVIGAYLDDDAAASSGSAYVFVNLPVLVVQGDITAGIGGNILSFTGQHMCFPEGPVERGLVVSANKNKFMNLNGILSTGLSAIKSSESLPIVSLSNVVNDPTVFGVVDSVESASSMRTQRFGGTIVENKKESGDNRVIVNSLGEGAMWVVNTNGNISSGDYITTSNINGYGHKQDDDILHSYTVAKITMDCDFNPQELPIQVIKKDNNGTNVLDNYGRLQWEDSDNTQKAYRIKYLKVDGKETDQANAVCTAAYVGCTYHCG